MYTNAMSWLRNFFFTFSRKTEHIHTHITRYCDEGHRIDLMCARSKIQFSFVVRQSEQNQRLKWRQPSNWVCKVFFSASIIRVNWLVFFLLLGQRHPVNKLLVRIGNKAMMLIDNVMIYLKKYMKSNIKSTYTFIPIPTGMPQKIIFSDWDIKLYSVYAREKKIRLFKNVSLLWQPIMLSGNKLRTNYQIIKYLSFISLFSCKHCIVLDTMICVFANIFYRFVFVRKILTKSIHYFQFLSKIQRFNKIVNFCQILKQNSVKKPYTSQDQFTMNFPSIIPSIIGHLSR